MIDLREAGRDAVARPAFPPTPLAQIERRAAVLRRRRRALAGGVPLVACLVLAGTVWGLALDPSTQSVHVAGRGDAQSSDATELPSTPPPGRPGDVPDPAAVEPAVRPTDPAPAPSTPAPRRADDVPATGDTPSLATVADERPPETAPTTVPQTTVPPTTVRTCARDGLVPTASTDRASYAPGQQVVVEGTLRNASSAACTYDRAGTRSTFRNAAGQDVYPTAHIALASEASLAPGETVTSGARWEQRVCVDRNPCAPAEPGRYTVTVTWSTAGGSVEATAPFEVLPG